MITERHKCYAYRISESTVVNTPLAKSCLSSILDNRSFYAKSFRCKKGCSLVGPSKKYTLDEEEQRKMFRFFGNKANPIVQVLRYKTMILHGKKFSSQQSSGHLKIANCIALLHDAVVLIRHLMLVRFRDGSSRAVCITSNVYVNPNYHRTNLVYRIQSVSQATTVSKADSLDSVKFISLFDSAGNMTHVCKLANTQELE